MQHAWNAAVAAFAEFIAALVNGELIANGVHPATGARSEIHPAEWARTGLVLNVRNGDLIEGWYGRPSGKHTVRWSAITLRAAKQPKNKSWERGHGYDWDELWTRGRCAAENKGLANSRNKNNVPAYASLRRSSSGSRT